MWFRMRTCTRVRCVCAACALRVRCIPSRCIRWERLVGLVAQNATAILPNAPTSVHAAPALAAAALAAAALAAAAAAVALAARRLNTRRPVCAVVALLPRGLYVPWLY